MNTSEVISVLSLLCGRRKGRITRLPVRLTVRPSVPYGMVTRKQKSV